MTDYGKLLNPEQCEAATAGDGPILVLAAAGTGKTRTLVYRVAYLMEQGVDPENILLLTFTNRAAREMLERAKYQVGDSIGTLWSGTFHHICNRFLRHFAPRLSFENGFTILDQDDSRSLINQCIGSCVKNKKDFPKKEVVASLISRAANSSSTIRDILEESPEEEQLFADQLCQVADLYRDRKLAIGAMDFDDLLVNGLRLIVEQEDVREFYQRKFRYILVDEYQDTNRLQAELVDLLAAKNRNLMVVGDDFQCIYSWRGANFKNIMEFPKRWPDCKIVKLEQNYRSVPEVLEVANACIRGNPEQFQKVLRPTRRPRRKPHLFNLRDGTEQSWAVIRLIRQFIQQGYTYNDMAVLYRAHFHSIELQMALTRDRLPFRITSGVGVYEQAHTKDVVSFLRVCEGARDRMAFERLLMLLDGVGVKSIERYWTKLGGSFDSSVQSQRETLAGLLRPTARGQMEPLLRLMDEYHKDGMANRGGEVVQRFCDEFYSGYLRRTYDNAKEREEDIRELGRQVSRYENGISGFLQEVSLLTNVDAEYDQMQEGDVPRIHLSTVHQAKGLEWPIVFIIWASEGMFPASKVLESGDDTEERRLFYVAVTRAKDELVICTPGSRVSRDGSVFFCKPSRFLKELPKGLLQQHYGCPRY